MSIEKSKSFGTNKKILYIYEINFGNKYLNNDRFGNEIKKFYTTEEISKDDLVNKIKKLIEKVEWDLAPGKSKSMKFLHNKLEELVLKNNTNFSTDYNDFFNISYIDKYKDRLEDIKQKIVNGKSDSGVTKKRDGARFGIINSAIREVENLEYDDKIYEINIHWDKVKELSIEKYGMLKEEIINIDISDFWSY